jgi:non-heme chloroperoxidase
MAHYDGVKSFSETDFCEDLKRIDVATLAMHGGHDKIVPYKALLCFQSSSPNVVG